MALKDSNVLRRIARLFIRWGDNVRPIIQKPLICSLLSQHRPIFALDAGCGRGLYTPYLADVSKHVEAIDINISHLEAQTRRQHRKNIHIQNGTVTRLPFADKTFDFVLFSEVLEHVVDDRGALNEIARVMKDHGVLLISVPHPPAPINDKEHVREGYTASELLELLHEYRFTEKQIVYCMHGISRLIIRIEAWWTSHVCNVSPAFIYWPLYIERWLPHSLKPGIPYDTIVVAELTAPSKPYAALID